MASEALEQREAGAKVTWHGAQAIDVGPQLRERVPKGNLRVELLTDPWSVWCWGFEPSRRTLELRYPGLHFRHLLGGMFPRMPDPREIGFDVDRFFSIVQRTTGMPIRADGIRRDPASSTYPACTFVHAVRVVEPERETAYLRALREAAYLDGLNISRPEVGAQVAARVGVSEDRFRAALSDGKAEASFREQLNEVHSKGLHAYPTFLFTVGGRTVRVEGFQTLPGIVGVAQSLTGEIFAPRPDPSLDAIVPTGERVATREVAEVLGVSVEQAFQLLSKEAEEGRLGREDHPTGVVWSRRGPAKGGGPARKVRAPFIQPAP